MNSILDPQVVEELKLLPQREVIRALFPGAVVKDRGKMPSPLRSDRNPSWSCFRSPSGIWLGKDFATGLVYNNIDLMSQAHPEMDFTAAVDCLSQLMLGRSAFTDGGKRSYRSDAMRTVRPAAPPVRVPEKPAIAVVSTLPLMEDGFPAPGSEDLLRYSRSRGIDDSVMSLVCSMSVIRIESRVGAPLLDNNGLSIYDSNGIQLRDAGLRTVISIPNGIGGISFREPDREGRKGFKGGTSSYPSFFMYGTRRLRSVSHVAGDIDTPVDMDITHDGASTVYLSSKLSITNVSPEAFRLAMPYLNTLRGRYLSERDVLEAGCVIDTLSCRRSGSAVVVEGMFDGLSYIQSRFRGSMRDLVILNGVGNIRHAAPFLASEKDVVCLFDHDLRSGAGMRAYDELQQEISGYCSINNTACPEVRDGSSFFEGYKDLNDWLKARRGRMNEDSDESLKNDMENVHGRRR